MLSHEFSRLHFGCLDQPIAGWRNTDITPHIWIARVPYLALLLHKLGVMDGNRYDQHKKGVFRQVTYLNVSKRFPYPDASFDCAFSSHVLEHLYPVGAENCLREVYRVLKLGGVLRIEVPDLDEFVKGYNHQDPDLFVERMFEGRQPRDKNRHHWMYNEHSLQRNMERAGFRSVVRCSFRRGNCPDVSIIDNRPNSLFMEGTK